MRNAGTLEETGLTSAAAPTVPLRDCCRVIRGVTFPSGEAKGDSFDGAIACLTTGAVQDEIAWVTARHVPERFMRSRDQLLQSSDLLMSTANSKALVGKLAIVRIVPHRATFGAFVTVLRALDMVRPLYLFYALRTERARRYFFERSSETTNISNLRTEDILDFEIPVLSLSKQERIEEGLTRTLAATDAARRAADARLAAAEALPTAYLREVFEGLEANSWKTARIEDVAPIQTGLAFKSSWFVEAGGVPILRNANIHQGFVEWTDVVSVGADLFKRLNSYSLNSGDIVLTLDRPIVANGLKVARLSKDDVPALLNQRVARFKAMDSRIDPDYLYAFLRSPAFTDAIRGHDQSLGVPHISPQQVGQVEIPLPPMAMQKSVVVNLSRQLGSAESLIARCREELSTIDALPASLLRAAFNGNS